MQNFEKIIIRNSNHIKYWLIVLIVVFMISAIKIYTVRFSIESTIKQEQSNTQKIIKNSFLVKNLENKYLQSDYSKHFLLHENNIILNNEVIIEFQHQKTHKHIENKKILNNKKLDKNTKNKLLSPQESRNIFIKNRIKNIK